MEDTASKSGAAGPVVIFGGRSEIGLELATRLAPGATVVLAARGADRLADEVAAVRAAGAAAVHTVEFDADDLESHGPLVAALVADYGPIGTAVLAFGILGDQTRAESDADHALAIIHTDYVAQISLLTQLASVMRKAGHGRLVVFSSVAGVTYQLQRCDDLTTGNWIDVGSPVIGAGGMLTLFDSTGTAQPQRFYRLKIQR